MAEPSVNDSRTTERRYFTKTGIFPIMHAVAIRNDMIDSHPCVPERKHRRS